MDIMKTIRAYNARLRTAIRNYGDDSTLVKDMITRAKYAKELTFNENGTISTGKNNILKNPDKATVMNISKFVGQNTTKRLLDNAIKQDELKTLKKEKDKEKRYASIASAYTKAAVTIELIKQIWQDMYDANYSVDDCNEVYDELKTNQSKYSDLLTKYQDSKIELSELVDKVITDKYVGFASVSPAELAQMNDLEEGI